MVDLNLINWGGSGIERIVFESICELIPEGATILELGSGDVSTAAFSTKFNVISIEENAEYLGRYNSHYIHAPIVDGWYKLDVLNKILPKLKYDLIFIDAPSGSGNRFGFLENIHLFNTKVPIVVHDTNREEEFKLINEISKKVKREFVCYTNKGGDNWGIV